VMRDLRFPVSGNGKWRVCKADTCGDEDEREQPLIPPCRRHLAVRKILTHFHIVPALPRLPITGKISRTAVVA
jgi:hypothetical protein